MNDDSRNNIEQPGRRRVLKQAMAAGAALVAGPYVIRHASAQAADLGPYQNAKLNWRQVEGEQITVAVIPASYFDNLIELAPQFEALTGIKVRFEKVPPGQIRQKAMLDLSSKTATYATHRGRSDVLPALRLEQMGRSARPLPQRRDAHRSRMVPLRRHPQGLARCGFDRRQALRHSLRRRDDRPGLSQGPLRRQGTQARRHARAVRAERQGAERPQQPPVGRRAARLRRRRPEHVHLSVDLPRVRRLLVLGRQPCTSIRRRRCARSTGTSTCCRNYAPPRCATGTGPTSPTHFRRVRSARISTRIRPPRCSTIRKNPKSSARSVSPAGRRGPAASA